MRARWPGCSGWRAERLRGALALALLVGGCAWTTPAPVAGPPAPVTRCTTRAEPVGRTPAVLDELSGLAASRRHPGIFWAHNDSGHKPKLFALGLDGTVRAVFRLEGARVRDLEDVAVGPCGSAQCVYLADVGDNLEVRRQVQLLRVVEPPHLEGGRLAVEALPFTYEDGPHDAESLVVEAATGRLWVLTKERHALGHLYRLDGLGPGKVGRAVRRATLRAPRGEDRAATAADLHPGGRWLLVRTALGVWEWSIPGDGGLEEVGRATPHPLPGAGQPQGEALAILPDASGYLLGSEGRGVPLYRIACPPPQRP